MNIRFVHELDSGIELIICKSSLISYPIHNHVSVFTVGFVLDGAFELTVGETTAICRSNDTFMIPPYAPHKITACGTYTLLSCCFNKNTIAAMPLAALKKTIASLLNGAIVFDDVSSQQSALIIESLNLLQGISAKTDFFETNLLKLIEQLALSPEKQVCLDDMAQAAYISKFFFIRKFKEEIGLTPHQFLIQNRVRMAQHLLNQYNTVTEAALTAGFCDQSHFIRNFKKIVGLTPTAYKTAYSQISLTDVN